LLNGTGRKAELHVIANEGLKPAEAIDMVQERIPTLPRTAAKRHLQSTLLRKHPIVIKGKPVVAQANTMRFIRVVVEKLRETDVLLGRFFIISLETSSTDHWSLDTVASTN
jgi:hypothetical protein